jgi:hypothetical protein
MTDETQNEAANESAAVDLVAEAAKAINAAVAPMLKRHDPRAIVQGLLLNAASLSAKILEAEKWTHQDVAAEFSQAMCASLRPQEKSRIQVVDAQGLPRC